MAKTSDTEPIPTKTFEQVIRMAFEAGIELAAHGSYDGVESIPTKWVDLKWRAFRDALAGDPWDPARWAVQNEEMNRRRQRACEQTRLVEQRQQNRSRSEKQERLRKDPSSPGHDCDY